jgi:hypothetical protein
MLRQPGAPDHIYSACDRCDLKPYQGGDPEGPSLSAFGHGQIISGPRH